MINPPQVRPEEPTAVTPHGGICGGKSQQWLSYPTKPHAGICGGGAGYPAPLPDRPATDEIFTMDPPPERSIAGTTAFMPRKQPYWLIWMCRCQSASSVSISAAGW